jgi:hypothetical protein
MFTVSTPGEREEGTSMLFNSRRRIDAESGRALEILGHAIEYLTDEWVHAGDSGAHGPLDAVQILMAANRKIYYECPVEPSLCERIVARFHKNVA